MLLAFGLMACGQFVPAGTVLTDGASVAVEIDLVT